MHAQAIVATTQQSRFHKETLETIAEDVDLKDLDLTVGDKGLLEAANLRLFAGVHYGLVGANGVGKCATSLLPALRYFICPACGLMNIRCVSLAFDQIYSQACPDLFNTSQHAQDTIAQECFVSS